MKRLIAFFYITATITAVSCKKNEHGHPMAGFNVANAVVGGTTVKVNTNSISLVSPYNGGQYAIRPGAAITITPNGSSTPWYNDPKPATVASKSYTLFLCGQAPTIESIFKEEAYPAPYLDSIMGVRVINLSPNSTPVNITQASNSGVNLFGNVAYKQITEFKPVQLRAVIPDGSLTFEVRSAADPSTVLTSYTLPVNPEWMYPTVSIALQRFRNITIIIKGLQGTTTGDNAFGTYPLAATY